MTTSTPETEAPLSAIKTSLPPSAQKLIEKNHHEHHVFYGPNKFRNHLAHHVVTNVALGCDKSQHYDFDQVWKAHDSALEKKGAPDNSVEISETNWKTYLGEERYYVNYLEFFDQQIQRDGIVDVFRKYALDPAALPYLISGDVHPILLLGFGVDAMDSRIVSEGLTEMCVEKATMKPTFALLENPTSATPAVKILDVLQAMRADKKFDSVKYDMFNVNMLENAFLLKPYVNQWSVQENEQDVREKMKELTVTATLMLCASSRPGHPKSPVLDFFFLHGVTSSLAVRQLIPHVTLPESVALLRAHYAALLMYYGARGRPALDRSYALNYPVSQSWDELIRDALEYNEAHLPKFVRTMKVAEADWGVMDGLWIKGAQMAIDLLVKNRSNWSLDGMFDEIWE